MAIHTGSHRHNDPRAALAAGDQTTSATAVNNKDLPRFAPNFSVYTLPPDSICLYSEDRKFFLHGALFCALADLIGTGKNFGQIIGTLEKKFPTEAVHEAIKRLIDRRYVVADRRLPATAAAGYWASLGLPLNVAEDNL